MERWREPWIEQNKKTKHWFVRWRERGEDGVIHKRGRLCESKSDAIRARDAKRNEVLHARWNAHDPAAMIEPLYQTYMRERQTVGNLRPGALRAKSTALLPWMTQFVKLGDITREALRDYRDELLDGDLSPISVAIRMREVKAFVRWLHFEGHMKENPWVKIELPQYEPSPRFLTDDEIIRLEQNATGSFKGILRMAYMTGMRQNEILQARWEDISWIKGRAHLTIWSVTAKTRRSRTISLRKELVELIGRKKEGPIFPDWNKGSLRWAWEQLKEKAKITGRCRFHDLRHTFCKIYLQGGGTIADLMQVTGHTSIVMMKIYAHFEVGYKTDRMDAIYMPDLTRDSVGRAQDSDPSFEVIEGNTDADQVTENDDEDDDNDAGSCAVLK